MLLRRVGTIAAVVGGLFLAVMAAGPPARATLLKSDLQRYVERLHALYPEAEVTGRFNDWRTVSIYRANAGLHLGYDIALDAGRAVPAGWSGRVVDIVPWTATEYAVVVEIARGYRVGYGHLHPTVQIGQEVRAGDTVGIVAHDHVDIKVRDRTGGYLDWGLSYGVLQDAGAPMLGLLPPPPYESGGSAGSGSAPDLAQLFRDYRRERVAYDACKRERDSLRDVVYALSDYIDSQSAGLSQSGSQMLAWYRAADRHEVSDAQVEAMNVELTARRVKVNRLIHIMEGRQALLARKEAAFRRAEAAMAATRQALDSAQADSARIDKIDAQALAAGGKAAGIHVNPDLARKADAAHARMVSYQERYGSGGVAKTAMDDAVKDYQRLHVAELLWEGGDEDAASALMW